MNTYHIRFSLVVNNNTCGLSFVRSCLHYKCLPPKLSPPTPNVLPPGTPLDINEVMTVAPVSDCIWTVPDLSIDSKFYKEVWICLHLWFIN